jgi:hypothetical protein
MRRAGWFGTYSGVTSYWEQMSLQAAAGMSLQAAFHRRSHAGRGCRSLPRALARGTLVAHRSGRGSASAPALPANVVAPEEGRMNAELSTVRFVVPGSMPGVHVLYFASGLVVEYNAATGELVSARRFPAEVADALTETGRRDREVAERRERIEGQVL